MGDFGAGDAETGAEVIEEGDFKFLAGLGEASMTSRACRPFSLTVPPEILRLVTKARISFSEALVLSGISDQAPIEPSDHRLGDCDGVALLVVGGEELMDETLGVDRAERVIAEAELAGLVGDDDGLTEQALGLDRPHERRFARRPHRIGRHPEIGEAERAGGPSTPRGNQTPAKHGRRACR